MKMPVWAYEDGGLVAYRELPEGYSVEPLAPGGSPPSKPRRERPMPAAG